MSEWWRDKWRNRWHYGQEPWAVAVATSSSFTQGVLREGASQLDDFFRFMEPRDTSVMLWICTRCPRVQSSATENNMRSADLFFCMKVGCSATAFFLTHVEYYYYHSATEMFLYKCLYREFTKQSFINAFSKWCRRYNLHWIHLIVILLYLQTTMQVKHS